MQGDTCICCWWSVGEAHFLPVWMNKSETEWNWAMRYGWNFSSQELRKLTERK